MYRDKNMTKKNFDANKYIQDYQKTNYKKLLICFRKDDPILDWIESQPRKGKYIKDLIKKDYDLKLKKKEKR